MMRHKSKALKRIAVLLAVFVVAVAVYFFWPQRSGQEAEVRYTAVEEPTLPVAYMQMGGREMAPLFGHMEDQAGVADRGGLVLLPADRILPVRISGADQVAEISYEVRSMDLERLIERTSLELWETKDGDTRFTLPIQNLLAVDEEYCLCLRVQADGRTIYYYTRIEEPANGNVEQMIALAEEFSLKTLDYEAAQALTMYMESVPNADNSTFGNVTLKSSFAQITWGNLKVQRTGDAYLTLRELAGDLANIELHYYVEREENGERELYAVTENFTMRWGTQRIYMMDFKREMNQVFTGGGNLFSGKRILLGINSGQDIYNVDSPNKRFTTFVANRELWSYDEEEKRAVKVFSFRGRETGALRENHGSHGIEILSVSDEGAIDFLVYGYMNRGAHEGWTGISMYTYEHEKNTLKENFFIPVAEPYEELKMDIERLSHKGKNGILYLMADGAVYGIDLTSREYVVVASGLTDDRYAVSADKSRIAWQEEADANNSRMIHIMDLDTGEKTQIGDGNTSVYKVLGFVGGDCVYGVGDPENYVRSNGRITGLYLNAVEIIDRGMQVAMRYEKEGYLISNVEVEDSRVHLNRLPESEKNSFAAGQDDTLVCNAEAVRDRMEGIGWYASDIKEKVYFVQTEREIGTGGKVRVATPKKISSGDAVILGLQAGEKAESIEFLAYGRGRFLGKYTKFADAVEAAYEPMGFVTDEKNALIWARGNKANAYHIRDVSAAVRKLERYRPEISGNERMEDGSMILDASGCTLSQVLYFVGRGIPVLANTGNGSYVYLAGYDRVQVTVYHPDTGAVEKEALDTAEDYFKRLGNDFICGLFTK